MIRALLAFFALTCLCPPGASAASSGCATMLPGKWAIKGEYDDFGQKISIDRRYVFKANSLLTTVFRTLGADGTWQEQASTGKWSVKQSRRRDTCVLTMSGSGGGETWGWFQTITIEKNSRFKVHTYRGLYMRRVK